MKHIKQKQIAIFLFVATFLIGCSNNENPVANKNEKQLDLKIIPANQVIISWDSTIYQHNTNWYYSSSDSSSIDSVANLFCKNEILIEEMWYPNEESMCGIPIRGGSKLIIRLNKPDTTIYKYGFQKNDGDFPIICFAQWRHYKYTYK